MVPYGAPESPYEVKNTFLHISQHDYYGMPSPCSRRQMSEPPKLRHGRLHVGDGQRQEAFFESQGPGSENQDSGSDSAMNDIDLAVINEPKNSASAVSTRQPSSESNEDALISLVGQHEAASAMCMSGDEAFYYSSADTGSTPELHTVPFTEGETGSGATLGKPGDRQRKRPNRAGRLSWDSSVVTVMVRQIPRQYTQSKFLEEVNQRGFQGLFNFLYLPFDLKKGINVGYGFVNFTDSKHAQHFRSKFDWTYLDKHMSMRGKPIRVHPASVQGYQANFQHFVQTKTWQKQDTMFSPLFFSQDGSGGPCGKTDIVQQQQQQPESERPDAIGVRDVTALGAKDSASRVEPREHGALPCAMWYVLPEQTQQQWLGGGGPSSKETVTWCPDTLPCPMQVWCMEQSSEPSAQGAESRKPSGGKPWQKAGGRAETKERAAAAKHQQPAQDLSACQACGTPSRAAHNFCSTCGSRLQSQSSSCQPVAVASMAQGPGQMSALGALDSLAMPFYPCSPTDTFKGPGLLHVQD